MKELLEEKDFKDFVCYFEDLRYLNANINQYLDNWKNNKKKLADYLQLWSSAIEFPIDENLFFGISINPIDFLTSGKYLPEEKSGIPQSLSIMQDSCTVVIYVRNNIKKQYGPIKQYNKIWKTLVHFSEKFSFCIIDKQYPFSSDEYLEIFKDYLSIENKFINIEMGSYNDKTISPSFPIGGLFTKEINSMYIMNVFDNMPNLLYNEVNYIEDFKCLPLTQKLEIIEEDYCLVGHPVHCAYCGKPLFYNDSILCLECKNKGK